MKVKGIIRIDNRYEVAWVPFSSYQKDQTKKGQEFSTVDLPIKKKLHAKTLLPAKTIQISIKRRNCGHDVTLTPLLSDILGRCDFICRDSIEHNVMFNIKDGLVCSSFYLASGNEYSVNACIDEILIRSRLERATQIIVVHNHPSGPITPSKPDYDNYCTLKNALDKRSIDLVDKCIVGIENYNPSLYSFRQHGS